jgi:SAM-dependent methyltransferase
VGLPCGNEEERAGCDLAALGSIEEETTTASDDVDLVPIVGLLRIVPPGRVELHLERAVPEDGNRQVAGRRRPPAKSLLEAHARESGAGFGHSSPSRKSSGSLERKRILPLVSLDRTGIETSYDRVADEYARRIYQELDGKPFDREILDRFADRVRGAGRVFDLGCGPGHVARYLHDRGVDVAGIDISDAMVRVARQLNPRIEFRRGDMRALESPDGSMAGIAAFYSIIHFPLPSLGAVFGEMRRVLAPGAPLLVAFHVGKESIHLDEWWGHPVALDFIFFDLQSVEAELLRSGFRMVEALERDPYPEVEHQSRRAYLLAEAS